MRVSFLTFLTASLVAAGFIASSAFNYADLEPRTVIAEVVTDDNGYMAIAAYDTDYDCYVAYTNGRIDVTWDGGTSCGAGGGTGVNPDSIFYFHDVLILTNKGTKTLTDIWLNMTDTDITININAAAATMTTSDTYAAAKTISNLAPGDSYYIGFKIDATNYDTSNGPISKTLSIEARTTV